MCRVATAASLGHGTLANLTQMAQQQPAASTSVFSAAALAAVRSSQSNSSSSVYSGRLPLITAAKQALQKTPMLSDLATWSSWELLFEQELGRLSEFVQQTGLLTRDCKQEPLDVCVCIQRLLGLSAFWHAPCDLGVTAGIHLSELNAPYNEGM